MGISAVNFNTTNYSLQKTLTPKKQLGFKAQEKMQSPSEEKSFYKKHKHSIWGVAGMLISEIPAYLLLKKSSKKPSFIKDVAITSPFNITGYISGVYLSKTLDEKEKKA